jgi:hypothetical protein
MLFSLLKDIWKGARTKAPKAGTLAPSTKVQLAPVWRVYGDASAMQQVFDVAVVMPTVGRASLRQAVQSVFDQAFPGRIQLLIGVDAPLSAFDEHERLFAATPPNVTVCFFYPGYSTSLRHGGVHPARDGGAMRAVLTYMANARYVAYLDDDNWWGPVHLQSLRTAADGKDWAYADRWFVDQDTRKVVGPDDWESVGPGRGIFLERFDGWVDPNCLMLDKLTCEPAIRLWTVPLPGDHKAMSADRNVFAYVREKSAPGVSGLTTTYYALQADDGMHPYRQKMIEAQADVAKAYPKPHHGADGSPRKHPSKHRAARRTGDHSGDRRRRSGFPRLCLGGPEYCQGDGPSWAYDGSFEPILLQGIARSVPDGDER